MTEQNKNTKPTITDFNEVWTGLVAGIAREALKTDPEKGVHSTSILRRPLVDSFGTFIRKWKYTEGCTLDTELVKPHVGEIVVSVQKSSGQRSVVSVGKTPAAYLPAAGGTQLPSAGDVGDYLMSIQYPDADGQTPNSFRYLDQADVVGVEVVHGDEGIVMGKNLARARQIRLSGTIEQSLALLDTIS